MLKKISAGKLSFLLSALLALSILVISGCGAWGKDAPASNTIPDIPPTTSWVPMFIQLANQPGTLPGLSAVVTDMMSTGQLQMVINALDISLRETGAVKMKELLRLILKDPVLREFAAPNGPLSVILAYPNIQNLLEVVHNLTINGITENAMVPMLKAVANSPLMRSFEPFGRELLRDGIPQLLPMVNGMATEMVPFPPAASGMTPALTPLTGVLAKNGIFDPEIGSDPTSYLAKNIISLMANDPGASSIDITTPITPLLAMVGTIMTRITDNPVMARNIVNGLGATSGLIDSTVMGGLRKTVYDFLITNVNLYPPDSSGGMILTPTSMVDLLQYILARNDSEGATAVFEKLKELESNPLTAGVLTGFAKAYAPYYTRNCVQTLDDFKEHNNPFVMKYQAVDVKNGKYSCFMQMMRLVYDTYKYKMIFEPKLKAMGYMATCGDLKCASYLESSDPEWAAATVAPAPFDTCNPLFPGKAPQLPEYPNNVSADYMYQMSRRTIPEAHGYTKYMVCLLHEQLAGSYLYVTSFPDPGKHMINDLWESTVVGFTVLGDIANNGGLNLFVPVLNTLKNLDDAQGKTTGGYVFNLTSVLAVAWGNAGTELNPLSPVLDASFGCSWDPLATQKCKTGSVESGLMYNVLSIVTDIVTDKFTVQFKGIENNATQLLINGLAYLLTKNIIPGADYLLRTNIAIPLYAFIQPDIDQFIAYASPGLKKVFMNPAYKAENLFHLLSIVLDEKVGNPSFTAYVDPTIADYYMPDFKQQAYQIVDAFILPMSSASGYLLENDPNGYFAAALSYMITNPTEQNSVAIRALNLFDELLDYNQNNIFLDFLSNFLNTGAFVILMEATDAANQTGDLLAVIPAAQTLVKYGVMPEFLDLLYQLIPLVKIGE